MSTRPKKRCKINFDLPDSLIRLISDKRVEVNVSLIRELKETNVQLKKTNEKLEKQMKNMNFHLDNLDYLSQCNKCEHYFDNFASVYIQTACHHRTIICGSCILNENLILGRCPNCYTTHCSKCLSLCEMCGTLLES